MSRIYLFLFPMALTLQAQSSITATATPTSLSFSYQSGATTLPAAQTLSVKASSGPPEFTAAVSDPTALWLTVSPASGTLPGTLDVRVNPTSLPVGIYNSVSVTITVAGVAAPLNVAVTLTVTNPASTLTVSPASLSFASPASLAAQTLTLSTNSQPISFTATSGSNWLLVSAGGTASSTVTGVILSPADPVSLTVSIDPTQVVALAPETAPYVAKITVVASGPAVTVKSQNITVDLTVNSLTPSITSVWPTNLPVNGPASWVTIIGTNFYSATVVMVSGLAGTFTPTILSSTQMLVQLPAAMLFSPTTLALIAANPAPGGNSTPGPASTITVANTPTIAQNGVVSAASYASDAVSPGELVTIFGTNIGPAVPAPMTPANGYVSTSLGGVTATIDTQNAPLVYVSANQLTVQVPYEVTLGANKNVVVTNGANPPASATVTINATAPGIFTANGSGTGQAAALNYDSTTGLYTLNSSTAPANIGDTVVLYMTGEGNYNPTLLTGAVNTNTGFIIPSSWSGAQLPELNPLPTVTIGGVDASAGVAYAGPMPGAMLGLLQINVTIPTGSATGAAVPISVTIGGVSTQTDQPNVTLAIHE